MAIVRLHCQDGQRGVHTPHSDWPDDCVVQWGGSGIVLGKNPRRTAFFEAFPQGEGFFRGEGKTIEEAEMDALSRYRRFKSCTEHHWARGSYTNGYAHCRRYGAGMSFFNPITKFGSYKAPLSYSDLESLVEGYLAPDPDFETRYPNSPKYRRRSELRLRYFGIKVPAVPDGYKRPDLFEDTSDDPYLSACRKAVVEWYIENKADLGSNIDSPSSSMKGLFDHMAKGMLDGLVDEYLKAKGVYAGPEA
jgi:hypothetical protein